VCSGGGASARRRRQGLISSTARARPERGKSVRIAGRGRISFPLGLGWAILRLWIPIPHNGRGCESVSSCGLKNHWSLIIRHQPMACQHAAYMYIRCSLLQPHQRLSCWILKASSGAAALKFQEPSSRQRIRREKKERIDDEACNNGEEQGVHDGDAGRRHRAQGAGGQAVHVRGEAGRVPARWPVCVSQQRRRRRACLRGVAEDGHVPLLLGAQLELPRRYVAGAGKLNRIERFD
jgi:hypothetical protein